MESESSRRDNRPLYKIRDISVKLGGISSADGSAEFSVGHTKVLAAVHGPVAAKSRHEQIDRSTLKITVESFDSAPSLKDVAMAQKLEKILHSIIFDLLHPRTLISITIQPLSLDGSYFAAAFNAAMSALLDSGVPLIRMAFAASSLTGIHDQILVDPEASEELSEISNRAEHLVVFDPSDFERSIASFNFGTFGFEDVQKASLMMKENSIYPVDEAVKGALRSKLVLL